MTSVQSFVIIANNALENPTGKSLLEIQSLVGTIRQKMDAVKRGFSWFVDRVTSRGGKVTLAVHKKQLSSKITKIMIEEAYP